MSRGVLHCFCLESGVVWTLVLREAWVSDRLRLLCGSLSIFHDFVVDVIGLHLIVHISCF